jgi:hypothetical protein
LASDATAAINPFVISACSFKFKVSTVSVAVS